MRPLRAVFTLGAGLVLRSLAAGAEGPALPEIVERFDHLRVGEAVAVSGLRLSAGHFECTLKSGRAAPVRAGEEVVGLFFEGEGTMEYVSVDPVEAPVVLFDTKKGSGLKAEKTERGVVLRDGFRRLLWLAQASPLPELAGPPAAPLADAFRKEREKFARMHTAPLSHDFALQRLNAPSAPLVWAEMEGGKEDLVYELDHVDHPSEALILLHPSESRDPELRKFLWPVALSHQPIGRDARDPAPPRFLLTAVDLDLRATAGNDVSLSVVETVVPVGAALSALRFDLDNIWYAQVGREPRHARRAGEQGDRRRGPRARLRPPQRRDHRPARRAGARGPAGAPALRDRRRLPRPSRRRQLLGARRVVLVSAALPRRAGLHVPRRRPRAEALRALRVGHRGAPRVRRQGQRPRVADRSARAVRRRARGKVRDAGRRPRRRHDPRRDTTLSRTRGRRNSSSTSRPRSSPSTRASSVRFRSTSSTSSRSTTSASARPRPASCSSRRRPSTRSSAT